MEELNDLLSMIGEFFIEKFRDELVIQGHDATGTLFNTMRYEIKGGDTVEIYMQDYAKFVDSGIRPGKLVSIPALIEWIEIKGIASGQRDIKNAAFAIRRKIQQEGSPTRNAFSYSQNGRRTGFIRIVADEHGKFILNLVREELGRFSNAFFDNVIKRNRAIFLQEE